MGRGRLPLPAVRVVEVVCWKTFVQRFNGDVCECDVGSINELSGVTVKEIFHLEDW